MARTASIEIQLGRILDEYDETLQRAIDREAAAVAKEAAAKLRNTSPRRTGEYARGWKSKRLSEHAYVVYNSKAPGLTHLLENGHLIRNKKGTYGRTSGIKHIKPVEEWASEEFQRRIEGDLS